MSLSLRALGATLAALSLVCASAGVAQGDTRRFALVASSNDGGEQRPLLRYANSDALGVARVLEELGGVAPADSQLLPDAEPATLGAALAEMAQRLGAARGPEVRLELVFYYSGHSDEDGLLLGGQSLPYRTLRRELEAVPADVRIAIVDSCASGALTRAKGGRRRAPFLSDSSASVKGLAILTSSSASEVSQESDRIQASFFTHYLVSGLRGAADSDANGRITLSEAYQHAFHETLARTERTQRGAQHPAYDFQLAGTGDLVMTDLRSISAGLVLSGGLEGRLYLRDGQGRLVAELHKVAGRAMELGLQPGVYGVVLDKEGRLAQGSVTLTEGARTELGPEHLRVLEGEVFAVRGGDSRPTLGWRAPLAASVLPSVSNLRGRGDEADTALALSLLYGRVRSNEGVMLAFGLNETLADAHWWQLGLGGNLVGGEFEGAQVALGFNSVAGEAKGLQAAVGANLARSLQGVQAAVGFNQARGPVAGAQWSVGFNRALGELRGAQVAVGFNLLDADVGAGMQAANGFNWSTGSFWGGQAAAGLNWTEGTLTGAQVAAVTNVAGRLRGAQVAVVNVAGHFDGAQVGVVNVAREGDGVQIGVVNVAERHDGFSLALLPLYRHGIHTLQLGVDDAGDLGLALKLGNERFYTLAEVQAPLGETRLRAAGFGLGVRTPLTSWLSAELDLSQVSPEAVGGGRQSLDLYHRLRLTLGLQPWSWLSVVVGGSLNLLVAVDGPAEARGVASPWVLNEGSTNVLLAPGMYFGVQLGEQPL